EEADLEDVKKEEVLEDVKAEEADLEDVKKEEVLEDVKKEITLTAEPKKEISVEGIIQENQALRAGELCTTYQESHPKGDAGKPERIFGKYRINLFNSSI
ncbi:MAG: hypothetical protein LDL06_05190, partial [Candidatus Nitrosotenuis sp.]|nr:hypothetical protein [Candidatus Nitrosotenuis sp.]